MIAHRFVEIDCRKLGASKLLSHMARTGDFFIAQYRGIMLEARLCGTSFGGSIRGIKFDNKPREDSDWTEESIPEVAAEEFRMKTL